MIKNLIKGLKTGLRGYFDLISRIALIALLCTLVLFISAAIIFPLWFFATQAQMAYSITVASISILALLFFGGRGLYRKYKNYGSGKRFFQKVILQGLLHFGMVLLLLAVLFLAVFLFSRSYYVWGGLSLLFLIIFFGFYQFDWRRRNNGNQGL